MSKIEPNIQRILNAMQLGTYKTVTVGNFHKNAVKLRVPMDTPIAIDDIVLFAAVRKGDPVQHTNSEANEDIFDYGQVTEVDEIADATAVHWIVQKVDLAPWHAIIQTERDAIKQITAIEAQRDHQNIMATYGDSLPEGLKGDFTALQDRFRGNLALTDSSKANDEQADNPAPDVDLADSDTKG